MYCRKCGARIPEGESFCTSCGAHVGNQMTDYGHQPQSRPPKNNHGLIIGIAAAVAVVLVAIIVCFTVLSKSQNETQLAQMQAQTEQAQAEADKAAAEQAAAEAAAEQAKTEAEAAEKKAKREAEKEKAKEKEKTAASTVNNYYYYGTGHASGDYYSSVSSSGYLWPTDSEYISSSDLSGYDRDTVDAIRNEVYARHGYAFSKQRWKDYFGGKSWYYRNENVNANTVDSYLTSIERSNINTIVNYEKNMGWY